VVDEQVEVRRRRPVKRWIALGLFVLVLVLALVIWLMRYGIAERYINRELERRGVQASYTVDRIGFRRQRLRNVVIGDPSNPDLRARWVEVRLEHSWRGPNIGLITARGVRLHGRIVDGRLTFGEVDKLLPPPTGLPFRFPDQLVDVADTAVRLDTPGGRVGLAIEGKGNLADGFRGKVAVISQGLKFGECVIERPNAFLNVAINDLRPTFVGPARAQRAACGDEFAIRQPFLSVNTTFAPAFDAWRGGADLRTERFRYGDTIFGGAQGRVSFNGTAEDTRGQLRLGSAATNFGAFDISGTSMEGRYGYRARDGHLVFVGEAVGRGVRMRSGRVQRLERTLNRAGGTPVEKIGEALAASVARAVSGFEARTSLRLVSRPEFGAVRFERLGAQSRSGARLGISGNTGVTYYWPSDKYRIDGDIGLSGGGFPATRLRLSQATAGGALSGIARIAPMQVRDERLELSEVRFNMSADGMTRVDTVARMSGPIPDGRIEGLVVPISGRIGNGRLAFGESCTPVSFQALRVGSFRLGRNQIRLCPTGPAIVWQRPGGSVQGGVQIEGPRLVGQLGSTPVSIAPDRLTVDFSGPSFTTSNLRLRLGRPGSVNWMDFGTFRGSFDGGDVSGTFNGGRGQIANVPLILSNATGRWTVRNGVLRVDGGVTVSDEEDPPRFYPLVSNDFELTLDGNEIRARGWLEDPEAGRRITEASIQHSLDTGRGSAILDVPGITFDESYQPEDLTRLTVGVVALVEGTIRGQGVIRWNENATTSTGTFSTEGMDLAAPFGPVYGLTTTINFTDLLGLTSAPGQLAQVDLIRTGIDVVDGRIRYQLLPNQRIRVEEGRWPFMGGELYLEETLLDFSQPSTHKLTFQVIGLDAAVFVREMGFEDTVEITGIFDGVLPMEFDIRGGRIVGGRLEARAPGGTLSYVGDVNEEAMGLPGTIAFNALRSLRYSRFIINLDGSLEGEFLAAIQLDGLATNTAPGGIVGMVISQLQKIPFRFNINIRGPFRSLIGTLRSLEDPGAIIQPVLPPELQDLPIDVIREDKVTEETVQPQESETMP
jgi:translocation and assembly module TamB